ncbi:lamin tail domain-containing protein [Dactylosporangium sp. CA-092794]|uniref:lamin tail domain-containing protein n=1 Tax=Dactylosporangium sp. CA-092794 TaxID=3239929 RepID=UPI003D8B304A
MRTTTLLIAALVAVAPLAAVPAAQAADAPTVRINEIESNGGTPGDWVELVNTGPSSVDLSGWVVKDNDDTHVFTFTAGTSVAAGGFVVADVDPVFGLGAADSARLFLPDGTLVDSYSWSAHAATTYGRCPDGTGAFVTTTSSTRGAVNDCSSPVRINEVESNGGTPGDWVELVNTGAAPVDLSGWVVKDNDDTHVFTITAGTTLAAGGHLALDVDPVFGLGAADSARLFRPDGSLVDAYSWTAHAATTYGRCPDGTGQFATTTVDTKGAANACAGQTPAAPWPGGTAVSTADAANAFGTNLSGLAYAGQNVLWAVKNGPGTLYRLGFDGTLWSPADTYTLHYPDGTGDLDAEGVTLGNGGVYVSTERNNANSGVSRPAVERFDPVAGAASLNATREWNLTADLPPVGANSGLEAITFVPDAYLTAHGFADEHTGAPYNPATYPGHGDGLFLVGLEANGTVYTYALSDNGSFTRVATVASGFPAVMDLQYEPETGHVWAVCDDTCTGRTATLDLDAAGKFAVTGLFERPAGMPNYNNEGFAIAPQSECASGLKRAWWSDDSNDEGHALRAGTIRCTDLDADDDGILDAVDPHPATAGDDFTGGRILDRAGRAITVEPGLQVTVGAGTRPALVKLDGSAATIALGQGVYSLAAPGTVATRSGEPAVVTVAVRSVPITLTVSAGGSVTYTDALTGIRQSGPVAIRAASQPENACAGIAVQNVIVGGSGNEKLTGTAGNDLILGLAGNDTVDGNGGADCVSTGSGNDTITTGDGGDWIDAGSGNNTVRAGAGDNVVTAGNGNDTITTEAGNDRIDAAGGNNVVRAGDGDNVVTAANGNDTIATGAGNDRIDAAGGNNVIRAGDGDNTIGTAAGDDKITTGTGSDVVDAGNGNNDVSTDAGGDTITTGSGNDEVDCGAGTDVAHPGGGTNTNKACETFTG